MGAGGSESPYESDKLDAGGGLISPPMLWEPRRFTTGDKIRNGPHVGTLATSPLPVWEDHRIPLEDKMKSDPPVGTLVTS